MCYQQTRMAGLRSVLKLNQAQTSEVLATGVRLDRRILGPQLIDDLSWFLSLIAVQTFTVVCEVKSTKHWHVTLMREYLTISID